MKKDNKPNTDKTPPLNEMANLDTCTQAPEFAEHARPNEPPMEPCDDGRAGTRIYDKEVNDMTQDKQKSEQCEDIVKVKERKEERQRTMDKMSVDTSEVHTYDKNQADDSEKCS
jgi:hypothetical protein